MSDLNHIDWFVVVADLTQEGFVEGRDFVQGESNWFVQLETVVYVCIVAQIGVTKTQRPHAD